MRPSRLLSAAPALALCLSLGCAGAPAATAQAPGPAPELRGTELAAAQDKLRLIQGYLDQAHTARDAETSVLGLLRSAGDAQLAYVLDRLDLEALFDAVDDRLLGPDNLTALLDLLARQRLAGLPVATRARVLDGLQRGATGAVEEEAIRDVLLGTAGRELTALKDLVDAGADEFDLEQLVFHDVDDEAVRAAILAHVAAQARACPSDQLKVLSDIDDTLYRNWVDPRYPPRCVYPGVRELYAELDRGTGDGRRGDLTFLTARPGLMEGGTHRTLREHGLGDVVVLTGSVTSVLTNEQIAAKKHENFVAYQQLFPEFGFVFLGDSGQGDVIAGLRMLETNPQAVRAVFIHDVAATPDAVRAEHRARRVFFHDTYVGAAVTALELGLIHRDGARRVGAGAIEDLRRIQFADPQARAARQAELQRDVERLNALLPEDQRLRP